MNKKKTALNYNKAVAAYHKIHEDKRALPMQPDSGLSELKGTTWFLRNVHGPLARVNHKGVVRAGRIE